MGRLAASQALDIPSVSGPGVEPDTALRIYIIRPAMALNYRAGNEPLAKNFTITIGLLLVKNVYSRLPIYDTIIKTLF